MVNTFISPVISRAAELGVSLYEDNLPAELHCNDSIAEVEVIIRAVYRQVLGNAYVMESERLNISESKLKQGSISVREFVRQVAQSELYRSRFFDSCPRYRSIELNFKHLLGRAPESYQETNAHSQILDESGYEAEINSYIDSDEYQDKFGENIVGFTHLFKLLRGASSSDKKLTTKDTPRLTNSLLNNRPSAIIPPSNINSYGGVTDINKLLTNALNLKTSSVTTYNKKTVDSSTAYPQFYSNIEQQPQELQLQIEQLQKKLADLNSFASIGKFETNKWQSKGTTGASSSGDNFQSQAPNGSISYSQNSSSQIVEQQKIIANLKKQIADAQRLATIGESRLNKWRNKVFF